MDQHDAATHGSLYQIAVAMSHLWLTAARLKAKRLPTPSQFYVYSRTLQWGDDLLEKQGKRIKVTVEIEQMPAGMAGSVCGRLEVR